MNIKLYNKTIFKDISDNNIVKIDKYYYYNIDFVIMLKFNEKELKYIIKNNIFQFDDIIYKNKNDVDLKYKSSIPKENYNNIKLCPEIGLNTVW